MARTMLPVTDIPPLVLLEILSPSNCAPGATPSNPSMPNMSCPAAIPATWEPWPELSMNRSRRGLPSCSEKFTAIVIGPRAALPLRYVNVSAPTR